MTTTTTTSVSADPTAIAGRLATASADFSVAAADRSAHHHRFDHAAENMAEEWATFVALDEGTRNAIASRLAGMLGSLMVASEAAGMPREAILAALAAGDR